MKAAWKIMETRFPWITPTPCGTHVMNLELKDIGKLEPVKSIICKVKRVLSIFWGRSRWPRLKLKEVIAQNHGGESWGLYRAKVTRFAGNVREMARMLRAKRDLQQIVVGAEYERRQKNINRSRKKRATDESESDDDDDEGDGVGNVAQQVKAILLDENDFWAELVNILTLTQPIVHLLRLMDSNKPCLGQVYYHMCDIGTKMDEMKARIAWAADASKIRMARWKYLHSPMHAAAYALDPMFMEHAADIDSECQQGLCKVIEKLMLRDVMLKYRCDVSTKEKVAEALQTYNKTHPEVIARVAQCEREFALFQQGEPPFNREAVRHNAKLVPPVRWWSMYGGHVELLQSVAQRVLGQLASASAAERNWSIYGQIKNDKALRLHHENADARVYAHEALHLKEKLNEIEDGCVEEWSDSDSNVSDEAGDVSDVSHLIR